MKGFIGHICLIGLISLILVPRIFAQESAPGKLLIKFKDNTSIRKDSEISFTVPFINQKVTLREEGVVLGGKKDTALESATNLTPNISNDSPIISVDVNDDSKLQESIDKYNNDLRVEFAELDYIVTSLWVPNDTYFQGGLQGYQWNLERIKIKQAWDITQGGLSQIKVAVIDSGVTTTIPEFSGTNFTSPHSFKSGNFSPTLRCTSVTGSTQEVTNNAADDFGHGTHVAATIAQKTNNNSHSAGIAFNTTIIPIKVLHPCLDINDNLTSSGFTSDIVSGINYAVTSGAKIINLSLGGTNNSQSQHDAIISANSASVTVVAAAGNGASRSSSPSLIYPAGFPETIAVGATRWDNVRSSYSQYTPVGTRGVDVVAPGGQLGIDTQTSILDQNNDDLPDGIVQQTIDQNNISQPTSIADFGGGFICVSSSGYYDFEKCGLYQGTSMATPHVTGVIALMLSVNPNLTPAQIKDILKSTAQTSVIPGYNTLEYGAGLLDAYAAVNTANSLNISPTSTPTPTPTTPAATATIGASPTPTPTTPISPTIPISLVGDLNNDNKVDMVDYNLFVTLFGNNGGPADFDSSGKVDIFDYAIFVSNFGKTI